jgi:hypothetical protein
MTSGADKYVEVGYGTSRGVSDRTLGSPRTIRPTKSKSMEFKKNLFVLEKWAATM